MDQSEKEALRFALALWRFLCEGRYELTGQSGTPVERSWYAALARHDDVIRGYEPTDRGV